MLNQTLQNLRSDFRYVSYCHTSSFGTLSVFGSIHLLGHHAPFGLVCNHFQELVISKLDGNSAEYSGHASFLPRSKERPCFGGGGNEMFADVAHEHV